MGSVEYDNWARAQLVMVPKDDKVFILKTIKRTGRLGWKDVITDEYTNEKYISHANEKGIFRWSVTPKEDVEKVITGETDVSRIEYKNILNNIPMEPNKITRVDLENIYSRPTINKYTKRMILANQIIEVKDGNKNVHSRRKE